MIPFSTLFIFLLCTALAGVAPMVLPLELSRLEERFFSLALLAFLFGLWNYRAWHLPLRKLGHVVERWNQGEMNQPLPANKTLAPLVQALLQLRQGMVQASQVLSDQKDEIHATRLANLEIQHQAQLAQTATQAKSAFLANMSHEIRSPMTAIVGMTELALATDLTREQRQYLDTVMHSANALLALINNILDYSKIEAGKLELERVVFDPILVVEQVCEIQAVSAFRKQLTLFHEFDGDFPDSVVGDPLRLQQVVTNLVTNAIKFTDSGQVKVSLGWERADLGLMKITVADSGIGIAANKLEHIFATFSQAEKDTSRHYGGSGLGLAISRQLVALMGGHLWVESTPGAGSRFHFTARCELLPASRPARQLMAEDLSIAQGRVLVAQAHEASRTGLCRLLEWQQLRVEQCGDGASLYFQLQEAAEAQDPFQMILLDGQLPGLEDDRVAQRLRGDDCNRRIVLMLPSGLRRVQLVGCKDLEIVRGLIKPVKRSELVDALTALFHPDKAPPAAGGRVGLMEKSRETHKLLLVEDNAENQFLVLQILGQYGYAVTVAASGTLASELLVRHPYDLLLLDIHLPDMDGYQLTDAIRNGKIPGMDPRLPILAITANALDDGQERCLKAGMNGYLAKPYKPRELLQSVRRLLAPHKPLPTPPPTTGAAVLEGQADPAKLTQFKRSLSTTLPHLTEAIQMGAWGLVEREASRLRDESQAVQALEFRNRALLLMMAARGGKAENALYQIQQMMEDIQSC